MNFLFISPTHPYIDIYNAKKIFTRGRIFGAMTFATIGIGGKSRFCISCRNF